MSKALHEKIAVIAVSDENAAAIAAEHGLAAGDWIRVNNERDYIENCAKVVGAVKKMAFGNDELADPACRKLIDELSLACWENHLKPEQRV